MEDMDMDSFLCWIGGKKLLRKEIIFRFPETKVERYIEVFGGAAWVLFGKEVVSGQIEVYNDIDGQLVNLYRCVKFHCAELQRELSFIPIAREQFCDFKSQLVMPGMTDIQRAARYYYIIKASFGADRRSFACAPYNVSRAIERLSEISERLQRVVVECKDFANLIKVYDRPAALFYCDPPYVGTEDMYDAAFGDAQHRQLREILGGIKGKFILSYNNCPYIRDLYDGFHIDEITRDNNMSNKPCRKAQYKELIIKNY
jgi:DNA adenine methylase